MEEAWSVEVGTLLDRSKQPARWTWLGNCWRPWLLCATYRRVHRKMRIASHMGR